MAGPRRHSSLSRECVPQPWPSPRCPGLIMGATKANGFSFALEVCVNSWGPLSPREKPPDTIELKGYSVGFP